LGIGGGIEGVNDLGVGDEDFFDDEVGTKLFDEVFFGVNGVFGLLLRRRGLVIENSRPSFSSF
jgi:hypothetical protein|tara:strand:- start:190 stop:378 length:189 start_codon:yes stop_codon:yes gene_type:complete